MKKLYTGVAAAALAATGLACGTGAAHADNAPWALGYAPSDNAKVSTAISDTTIYTAVVTGTDTVEATSTDRTTGATTHTVVSLAAEPGYTVGEYVGDASVAVTSTGLVLVSTDQADDNTDEGTDDRVGIWTAQLGNATTATATETISGLDGTGTLAVSPDGTQAALTLGWEVYAFAPSSTITAKAVSLAADDTDQASASQVAVANDGTVYAVGDDYPNGYDDSSTPTLWTLASGSDSATARPLKYEALSVATAGTQVVVGESSEDDPAYELQTFSAEADGAQPTASVALPDEPYYLAVSPDNGSVAASDGWDIYSLDLSKLGTYGADTPILEGSVPGVDDASAVDAVVPTADTVYAVTQSDADGNGADATISRVTKPGTVTDATQQVSGNEIDLNWTAPAQDGGSDLTYVVTATDTSGNVVTDQTQDTSDSLGASNGLVAGRTYAVTVRAENFAFQGDAVPVASPVGTATVTLSGSAVVGGTLKATVSKSTFPAGTKLSYQWGYSGGQYGGAIEGADKATYSPTKDMVGMRVSVIVTATHEGYSPAQVRSAAVLVKAATTSTQAPAPVEAHVTKIKPAKVKAGSKKLALKLGGVTSAPGKVKVYEGKKLVGKGSIKDGKLVLKLKKKLHKGKHKLTVKYAGSAQVAAFTKTVKVQVK